MGSVVTRRTRVHFVGTQSLPGRHTSEAIAEALLKLRVDYGLYPYIGGRYIEPDVTRPLAPQFELELAVDKMALTTDSASNMQKFADSAELFDWQPCICHLLNTAVTKGLDVSGVTQHMSSLRELSKHLKRSNKSWEAFRECQIRVLQQQERESCIEEGQPPPTQHSMCSDEEDYGDAHSEHDVAPLEDDPANGVCLPEGDRYTADQPSRILRLGGWCKTRWNSTFFLMKRALLLEKSISMFTRDLRPRDKLTDEHIAKMRTSQAAWSSLKQVEPALESIRELSERCEGDSYVTISDVLHHILKLVHDVLPSASDVETTAPIMASFVRAFKGKLLEDVGSVNQVYNYALAAAVDGRRSSLHWMRRMYDNPEDWPHVTNKYPSLEIFKGVIRDELIGLVSP